MLHVNHTKNCIHAALASYEPPHDDLISFSSPVPQVYVSLCYVNNTE